MTNFFITGTCARCGGQMHAPWRGRRKPHCIKCGSKKESGRWLRAGKGGRYVGSE